MDIKKIKFTHYEVKILLLTCLAQFITSADNVTTALIIKDIMHFFNVDITLGQVITSSYSITSASLLLISGLLGYFFSWKRIFQVGLILCIIGEFFALVLSDFSLFILFSRVLFGIGGSLILPSCLALISTEIHPKNKTMAFSIWGTSVAFVVAIYPLILNLITTLVNWKAGFVFLGLIGFCTILLSPIIKYKKPMHPKKSFDFIGSFIILIIVALTLTSISYTPNLGFISPKRHVDLFGYNTRFLEISIPMLLIILSFTLYVIYKARNYYKSNTHKYYSILPNEFFTKEALSGFYILGFLYVIYGGILFIIVSYVSLGEYSKLDLSIIIASFALSMFISSIITASKARKITIKNLNTIALLLLSLCTFYLGYVINSFNSTLPLIIVSTSFIGIACGMLSSKSNIAVNLAVGPTFIEQSSGAQICAKNTGYVLGVAIFGGILSHIANAQLTQVLLEYNSIFIINTISDKLNFISSIQFIDIINQFDLSTPTNALEINNQIRTRTFQQTLYFASFISLISISVGRSVKNEGA